MEQNYIYNSSPQNQSLNQTNELSSSFNIPQKIDLKEENKEIDRNCYE